MYHLYKFRKGWQSEHLAKYILSKFSFIAEPSTISDDLGSDFFCTFFDVIKRGELLPRFSFSIQIKSNKRRFDITNKIEYLNDLRTPFLVGVANKKSNVLTIYSGECLSNFLSQADRRNKKIFIKLVDKRTGRYPMYKIERRKYILEFPKILDIETSFDYVKTQQRLIELVEICHLTQSNITARKNGDYFFKRYGRNLMDIYAGPGSVIAFRERLLERLAAVFYNLEILYRNDMNNPKLIAEFRVYEKLYLELEILYSQLQPYLADRFKSLKKLIDNTSWK